MATQRSKGRGDANAPYQVVARRFRPQAFDEVVGQEAIQATLKAELSLGRVPHAFLFAGTRGVGKTTTARILARCLNCERGPTAEPCGSCDLCKSVLDGSNPDVIEIDAASNNRVEDVRALRERIAFAPMMSRYKVYILDEAHMLSPSAWNALLKTLEEPPPGVVFVLATTELHKVPNTIRSRCQLLQFRRINDEDIARRLGMIAATEGVELAADVLAEIAVASRGSMRDAETALERVLQLARDHDGPLDLAAYRELTQRLGLDRAVEVTAALLAGDAAAGLRFCSELQRAGADEREALGDLVDVLRALMVLQVDGEDSGLVQHTGAVRERLQELARTQERQRVEAMIQAAVLGRDRLRRLEDRAAILELTVVRMAEAGTLASLAELIAGVRDGRLATAPAGVSAGAPAAALDTGPAGDATTGPVDIRAALLAASKDEHLLHATLELCTFDGPDEEGRVKVSIDTDRKMHKDRIRSPQVQQKVSGWLQQALGRSVTLVLESEAPAGTAPVAAPPGPAARRVLDRFGGRVVPLDPQERSGGSGGDEPGGAPPEDGPLED